MASISRVRGLPAARGPGRPRRPRRLLRPVRRDRSCRRTGSPVRDPHLAGQPGLGDEDRLRQHRARPGQPRGCGSRLVRRNAPAWRARWSSASTDPAATDTTPGRPRIRTRRPSTHVMQARSFAAEGVDLVHAMTITTAEEGIGVVRAARSAGLPVAVSFTVEPMDGYRTGRHWGRRWNAWTPPPARLVRHQLCPPHAHGTGPRRRRLARAGRCHPADASTLTHDELDSMDELDEGDLDLLMAAFRAVPVPPAQPRGHRRMLRHRRPARGFTVGRVI